MTTSPPAAPARVARLPRDPHGRPVPWFVAWIDGVPDFRVVGQGKVADAIRFGKCFICGEALGRWQTFPVGPVSTINRSAPEPPSHKDCALYAVQVCPFLVRPGKGRRTGGLPEGHRLDSHGPGHSLEHNPGVTALWTTRSHQPFDDGRGGALFRMGDPEEVAWYAEGRAATRAEVLEALEAERATLAALIAETPSSDDLPALEAGYREAVRLAPLA